MMIRLLLAIYLSCLSCVAFFLIGYFYLETQKGQKVVGIVKMALTVLIYSYLMRFIFMKVGICL